MVGAYHPVAQMRPSNLSKKINAMEEIIEKIVKYALKMTEDYGPDDRYTLLGDVARRLEEKADRLIALTYVDGMEDE